VKPLVIFGASQFADLVRYYFAEEARRPIAAFTVDDDYASVSSRDGLPVVPFSRVQQEYPPDRFAMFVALGPHGVNRLRAERYDAALEKGYELSSFISARADVWPGLSYGPNTLITESSVIMAFTSIGANVVLFGARIGHHSTIDDHCMLSGAALAGGVHVGERTFIGVNASVREQVRIGRRNVIGAGAVILKNTHDDAVHAVHHTRALKASSRRFNVV
jgi:sugar O-acyltransferase (sialic acid O-acetyltransferase NeuD family)